MSVGGRRGHERRRAGEHVDPLEHAAQLARPSPSAPRALRRSPARAASRRIRGTSGRSVRSRPRATDTSSRAPRRHRRRTAPATPAGGLDRRQRAPRRSPRPALRDLNGALHRRHHSGCAPAGDEARVPADAHAARVAADRVGAMRRRLAQAWSDRPDRIRPSRRAWPRRRPRGASSGRRDRARRRAETRRRG